MHINHVIVNLELPYMKHFFDQGNKMFCGQYFYKPLETVMGHTPKDEDGNVRFKFCIE